MITLTYFQFACERVFLFIFLVIPLILGIGFTWRIERNRYEHLIDIFREKEQKLSDALRDEILKNEKLSQQIHNQKTKIDLLKKKLNSVYGKK